MPILREHHYFEPYLAYDAPVNAKTEEVRRMFDMDPETGYPREYNWRCLAKLGKEYRPEDAFEKLLPYREESMYSTYLTVGVLSVLIPLGIQMFGNALAKRPWYSRPWLSLAGFAVTGSINAYIFYWTPHKQGIENAIYIDYVKSHPERFETKKRLKHREVLRMNEMIR